MILCDGKTYYVGITNDLIGRFKKRKGRRSFFTEKFSKFEVVYCERYDNRFKAAEREKQIKGWRRAKKQMLVNGKLGRNVCTGLAKAWLEDENLL